MEMPDEIAGRQVVLWALIGSRNYGLATEGSDEDHMAFVAPLFDDLYDGRMFHRQAITLTDDVVIHDVRKVPDLLWKANPSFLEALFSADLRVPETFASEAMGRVVAMRDRIATMNLPALWRATMGIHTGRMARLERGTESTQALVDRYGYDTKQAMHAIRMLDVLDRFAASGFADFGGAIRATSEQRERLLSIKSGAYTLEGFRELAEARLAEVETLRPLYESRGPDAGTHDEVDAIVRGLVRDGLGQSS